MYCNQCGREVDIGWNVCPNCGALISKQGVGNEYYHDGGNMYNDRPMPQMKWYKFIIYVQIFGNANLIDFQAIMDINYPVIYIVLNHIYFKKREYLFIN